MLYYVYHKQVFSVSSKVSDGGVRKGFIWRIGTFALGDPVNNMGRYVGHYICVGGIMVVSWRKGVMMLSVFFAFY